MIARYSNDALTYGRIRERCHWLVCDTGGARYERFPFSERHIQCVWYDNSIRPDNLVSSDGEQLIVDEPGRWNLEEGPDFLGATLRIGPDMRTLVGDVEVHIRPADWTSHGHSADPRYKKVIAHVTFFQGALTPGTLPGPAVQVSLDKSLKLDPGFSLENIDVAAYPFASRANITPCSAILSEWPRDAIADLLFAAGAERIRQKVSRLSATIQEKGREQALYEEIMSSLGYKKNRAPFRRLASLLPLDVLRSESAGEVTRGYALLMGVSGLLPDQSSSRWDNQTRKWVRGLWDMWWKHRNRWASRELRQSDWILSGIRPQNHPRRRLMAAAGYFTAENGLIESLDRLDTSLPAELIKKLTGLLTAMPASDGFLDRRLGLASPPASAPVAFIGTSRAAAMVTNVLVPFLLATGDIAGLPEDLLAALPRESNNSLIRQAARNLFGRDYSPTIYRTGIRQQGLVQILSDFCLNDKTLCSRCKLSQSLDDFNKTRN